jgi:hypothetical protein
MGNSKRWIKHLVFISTLVGSLVPVCATAQEPTSAPMPRSLAGTDPSLVYRFDLMTDKLIPTKRDDMKVGYIYYHFSPKRNAWAWSYWQKDGRFWYDFGEGTTQNAWLFDIRATPDEVAKRLQEFPALERRVAQYAEAICLRLQADGRWRIVGTGIVQSIFNLETGERWQQFSSDRSYIPVLHTGGNSWTVRNGKYEAGSAP